MFFVNFFCFNFVCDRVVLYVYRVVVLILFYLNFLMEICICFRLLLRIFSVYILLFSSILYLLVIWCSYMIFGIKLMLLCRRLKVS